MGNPENIEIPSASFNFNGESVILHGLALPHLVFIVRDHRDSFNKLYLKAVSGELELNALGVAFEMADEFAPVVGKVIACGMGRPDLHEKMSKLPILPQIEALELIVNLTLVQEGGLEKLMETVTRVLRQINQLKSQKP